jgi:hypothetical protein
VGEWNIEPVAEVNAHYQVDLTGTSEKVRLSGLSDSEWLA